MLAVLPVVFTLVTMQEVGEELRAEVEEELMTVGEQLSVTIEIKDVERFGKLASAGFTVQHLYHESRVEVFQCQNCVRSQHASKAHRHS